MTRTTPACATWLLSNEFVAGLTNLVPAYLPWSHFLYIMRA